MFRLLEDDRGRMESTVTIEIDGYPVIARIGETVASALLREGASWSRTTPVSGARRAPYCMMGVCFECLMLVEGEGLVRACQTPVRDGLKVERQMGPRKVGSSC
ncbi:(2Fe-2S)-binding protein [Gluconobacter oxydans]|uniref:(2Fe-2S)-binding protein n=1 Tax=Gluconobacter oxydans TaxID=442 RepID=UPI001CD8FCDA|nr:(2Fe-2S)-binding protein [Gluconobacter oxydans]